MIRSPQLKSGESTIAGSVVHPCDRYDNPSQSHSNVVQNKRALLRGCQLQSSIIRISSGYNCQEKNKV